MKNLALALLFFSLATATVWAPVHHRDVGEKQLVAIMRFLNTYEYSYLHDRSRFASAEEFLRWLQETGKSREAPMDLSPEGLKPYELRIALSQDGKHYQISLLRPSDMHDRSTWCKPAAFTDDRGVIFLGRALGCEGPGQPSAE